MPFRAFFVVTDAKAGPDGRPHRRSVPDSEYIKGEIEMERNGIALTENMNRIGKTLSSPIQGSARKRHELLMSNHQIIYMPCQNTAMGG